MAQRAVVAARLLLVQRMVAGGTREHALVHGIDAATRSGAHGKLGVASLAARVPAGSTFVKGRPACCAPHISEIEPLHLTLGQAMRRRSGSLGACLRVQCRSVQSDGRSREAWASLGEDGDAERAVALQLVLAGRLVGLEPHQGARTLPCHTWPLSATCAWRRVARAGGRRPKN